MIVHGRYSNDRPFVPKAVIGLGFGDEGKGMAVAHETGRAMREGLSPVTVRFNGGPQAGHNVRVACSEGKVLHHTFSQFGSGGIFGAETIITKGMLFNPMTLAPEATHLSEVIGIDVMSRIIVDERCPVVLPMHVRANRMLETMRGDARHGSTGSGIGVARACENAFPDCPVITVRTLLYQESLRMRMRFWRDWIEEKFSIDLKMTDEDVADNAKWLHDGMASLIGYGLRVINDSDEVVRNLMSCGTYGVVFEGSQGLLLDERFGWFPHVTYGDMTADKAREVAGGNRIDVMGVTRTYQTRHGAGPMPTEGTFSAHETDNVTNEWAGEFRTGLLDMPRLANMASMVDEMAVSHMDRSPDSYVSGYDGDTCTVAKGEIIDHIEDRCGKPVTVVGYGHVTCMWDDRNSQLGSALQGAWKKEG